MTIESCFYCGQPVDSDDDASRAWVPIGRYELPAHKSCDERNARENGPSDNILDPHGVGDAGWAENH